MRIERRPGIPKSDDSFTVNMIEVDLYCRIINDLNMEHFPTVYAKRGCQDHLFEKIVMKICVADC